MITDDVRALVADNTNFFHRSTDSSQQGGLLTLDTYCTRNKIYMRLKATQFYLDGYGNLRRYLASEYQMPPSNLAMPRQSDSI